MCKFWVHSDQWLARKNVTHRQTDGKHFKLRPLDSLPPWPGRHAVRIKIPIESWHSQPQTPKKQSRQLIWYGRYVCCGEPIPARQPLLSHQSWQMVLAKPLIYICGRGLAKSLAGLFFFSDFPFFPALTKPTITNQYNQDLLKPRKHRKTERL